MIFANKKLLGLALAAVLLASCRNKKDREYQSEEIFMGDGRVHSWIITDSQGKPKSMGLTMTATALDHLPDTTGQSAGHSHNSQYELQLMPAVAAKTPFKHIVINWNPSGHQPKPIYAAPHFDFHFYMMSSSERLTIKSWNVDSMKFSKKPPADYLPVNYFDPGPVACDAEMGTHWVDATSPELQNPPTASFTYHFVYGTYDGAVKFWEPMITYDFFKSMNDFTRDIPRAAKVITTGYYPTRLHIFQSDGNYTMAFENMEYRTAE